MKIGEVAKLAGIGIDAIRFYEQVLAGAALAQLRGIRTSARSIAVECPDRCFAERIPADDNSRMEKMINGEQTDGRGV